jgi:PAS domain S-box-containing protein
MSIEKIHLNLMSMKPSINSDRDIRVPDELLGKAIISSPYGYVINDCRQKDNPIIFVNKAFKEITGYEADDVLGKNCRLLLGEDRRQESLERLQEAIKNGYRCTVVIRNYKKNGSIFCNELTFISSIKDQSGKEAYRLWSLRDATDVAEQEMKTALLIHEKDERFSAYMKNAKEAIWRIDFDPPISIDAIESIQVKAVFEGVFTEANDGVADIYGYEKGEDICGRLLNEFMEESNSDNASQVADLVRKRFHIENLITFEKGRDDTTTVVLNNISPTMSGNKVLYIWGTALNVTKLFKTQEHLRKSEEKLANQKMVLEETNIALKVLVGQIEIEKRDLADRIMANIENIVLPSLEKIRSNKGEDTYIEQHRIALEKLTTSFGKKISDAQVKLSPREKEVCGLVRNGVVNKDIASMLKIAVHTVEKHRRTVRKKLGITNKGINLHTYLNSL